MLLSSSFSLVNLMLPVGSTIFICGCNFPALPVCAGQMTSPTYHFQFLGLQSPGAVTMNFLQVLHVQVQGGILDCPWLHQPSASKFLLQTPTHPHPHPPTPHTHTSPSVSIMNVAFQLLTYGLLLLQFFQRFFPVRVDSTLGPSMTLEPLQCLLEMCLFFLLCHYYEFFDRYFVVIQSLR